MSILLALSCSAFGAEDASKPPNLFQRWHAAGFSLRRALSGPDKGEAAEFSILDDLRDGTTATADFALSWVPQTKCKEKTSKKCRRGKWGPFRLSLQTSLEGKIASDDSKAEDAWRFRQAVVGDTSQFGPFNFTLWTLAAKHEADRDFKTNKTTAEFRFTPTWRALAIGTGLPAGNLVDGHIPNQPPVQVRWRPFFGLDAGGTIRRGQSKEEDGTVLRVPTRLRAEIFVNVLAEALGISEATFFADDTFHYLPLEQKHEAHNLFVGGLELSLTENVSVGATYKLGEDAPVFSHINTVGGTIGVRF